jgi:hypothetical protein
MKARRLIESSILAPEPLHVAFQAFDAAWAEISSHFDGDERATQDARMKLAHAVLIVTSEDADNPVRVKNDDLQVMALAYQTRGPLT